MTFQSDPALQELIRQDNPNFTVLHSMNFDLALQLNLQWLPVISEFQKIKPELYSELAQHPKSKLRLNQTILDYFDIDTNCVLSLTHYQQRLLLMNYEMMENLCFYLGASLNAHWLRKIILGKDVNNMKSWIGENLYNFTVKRLPFLYPWVMSQESFCPKPSKLASNLKDDFLYTGLRLIYMWFNGQSMGTLKRLELRFPPTLSSENILRGQKSRQIQDIDSKHLDILIRKIIKEKYPTWAHLFN